MDDREALTSVIRMLSKDIATDSYSLKIGQDITICFPRDLNVRNEEELADLEKWFAIISRKILRFVAEPSHADATTIGSGAHAESK